jgi:hypothetical protein
VQHLDSTGGGSQQISLLVVKGMFFVKAYTEYYDVLSDFPHYTKNPLNYHLIMFYDANFLLTATLVWNSTKDGLLSNIAIF